MSRAEFPGSPDSTVHLYSFSHCFRFQPVCPTLSGWQIMPGMSINTKSQHIVSLDIQDRSSFVPKGQAKWVRGEIIMYSLYSVQFIIIYAGNGPEIRVD